MGRVNLREKGEVPPHSGWKIYKSSVPNEWISFPVPTLKGNSSARAINRYTVVELESSCACAVLIRGNGYITDRLSHELAFLRRVSYSGYRKQ